MLEHLAGLIVEFIRSANYLGIFLLMTLESALVPIPSEVTMPFSGFLAASGSLSFVVIVIVGAVGNLVGSLIAYYIGYFLEETVIISAIKKYGKFILVTEDDYKKAYKWFQKYGFPVVFFSRLLPAVRTFISLPAGIFKMNIWKFIIYTFIGSLIWSFVLTYFGFYLGKNWNSLSGYFRKFDILIVVLLVLVVLLYVNHKLKIVKLKIF